MNFGFIKAQRGNDGMTLARKNRAAFILLYFIAMRARWSDAYNEHDLKPGEALIGGVNDPHGLTEQEYKTAKKLLAKDGFATFRGTSRGTIATLINTRVFDINSGISNEQNNDQTTSQQPAGNEQVTTNKEGEEQKNGKKVNKNERPAACGGRPSSVGEVEAFFSDLTLGYEITGDSEELAIKWAAHFIELNNKNGWHQLGDWKAAAERYVGTCVRANNNSGG
jgi:hypothetical protein